jgi:hypothetical protein
VALHFSFPGHEINVGPPRGPLSPPAAQEQGKTEGREEGREGGGRGEERKKKRETFIFHVKIYRYRNRERRKWG